MWNKIDIVEPPKNLVIDTIIKDQNGERNHGQLKYDGKLWWTPDSEMYVYYTPTHWRYL